MTNLFQTHWFGCWRDHHDCAVAMVEKAGKLCEEVLEPTDLDVTEQRVKDYLLMVHGPKWGVVSEGDGA